MLQRITRTPLLAKLIVLDSVVNVFAFLVMQWVPPTVAEQVLLLSLFGVLVLNAALVAWALLPLQVLEGTARRVSNGEFSARALMPALADPNLARIGETLNALLDKLAAERARVRTLAGLVVAAEDAERAHIARELHDGTAQSLSALDMLLTSTLAEGGTPGVTSRLTVMKTIVTDALVEVRSLAQGLHPRVLDDLGLAPAVEQLARQAQVGRDTKVTVVSDVERPLPADLAAVVYRVAQEALHNALRHGNPDEITVEILGRDGMAGVVVRDDGCGFDKQARRQGRKGMGLFVMKERVSLMDGTFSIESSPGRGTVVRCRIPMAPAAEEAS